MAFLPLATVSSITEALIPLTKSGGKGTSAVVDALKGVKEGHKIFVQDIPLMLKRKYKCSDNYKLSKKIWSIRDFFITKIINYYGYLYHFIFLCIV